MTYSIGDHQLDPLRRELRSGHALRRLEPQVFDTLLFLIENRHRVVSRDELIAAVWNGRCVTDASVDSRISAARKAIGDDGRSQRAIRTVSRRGFHFVAEVEVMDGGMGDMAFASDKACVAVLPFRNLGRDCELGHFIEGMVGDLTADLSRFPSLRVVSRSVSARYGQEPIDLRRMSRELGVQYAVEGSVEETGERLRLTVQLAEASSGTQLWAQRFDIDSVDLTGARDEIRMIIVGSLAGEGGPLTRAEQQRAMRKSSDELTAHDLLWRAEGEFWKFDKAANRRARTLLERSLALDPGNVGAHALLAWVHWSDVQRFTPECRETSLDLAHQEARTCVALDPADYRGHWVLGAVLRLRGEPDAAMAAYERAFDLNQSDPDLLAESAEFLSSSGRADQAVAQVQRAITFNRFHPDWYLRTLGRAYYNAQRYEDAINIGKRFQNPRVTVLETVAASYAQLGHDQAARETVERILSMNPDHSLASFIADNPEVEKSVLQHFAEGLRKAGLPEGRIAVREGIRREDRAD